jgi:hypothetical protein
MPLRQVLYLTEAIDEAVVTNLAKFGEHELVDVSKEGVKLGDADAEKKVRRACTATCVVCVCVCVGGCGWVWVTVCCCGGVDGGWRL